MPIGYIVAFSINMFTLQHIRQLLDTKDWRIKSSNNVKNTATHKVTSFVVYDPEVTGRA